MLDFLSKVQLQIVLIVNCEVILAADISVCCDNIPEILTWRFLLSLKCPSKDTVSACIWTTREKKSIFLDQLSTLNMILT